MRLGKIPAGHLRRVHRRALPASRASRPSPASAPRSSIWPAICRTTCSVWRTRRGTTCRAAGARACGLEDLHATLRRLLAEQDMLFEAVWQRLTLAQRGVLRAVVLERRRGAARRRHARAPSPRRRVQRAGVRSRRCSATTSLRAKTTAATSVVDRCCASGWRGRRTDAARCGLRRSSPGARAGIRHRGGADARAGHRRQHGDFQPRQRLPAAAPGAGPDRIVILSASTPGDETGFRYRMSSAGCPGLPRAGRCVFRGVRVRHPDRRAGRERPDHAVRVSDGHE